MHPITVVNEVAARVAQACRDLADLKIVTVTGGVRTTGDGQPYAGPPHAEDDQSALHLDLIAAMTREPASVARVLAVIHERLAGSAGLRTASVFTLNPDDGALEPAGGNGDDSAAEVALAGRVLRGATGGGALRDGDRLALRLRMNGLTLGVLVLAGSRLDQLRPATTATLVMALSATVHAIAAEGNQRFIAHATPIIRRLFEDGMVAASIEDAGELLARSASEAFRTENAGVYLIDTQGKIRYAAGVGVRPELNAAVKERMIGKTASDSPVWRASEEAGGGALLVDDVSKSAIRAGGFIQTLELRSYVVLPLNSGTGPVGMVVCGDASGTRHWTREDRLLAGQLAIEGALIVDSARLRDAEAQHVAELTRRAYHDALTGLPNRAQLLLTANRAVAAAERAGRRAALLLLDLDGFKKVNDTAGHHVGDVLLQLVSTRLLDAVRDNDMVARLGGDEFAVLLTRDPDETVATAVAARIHRLLIEPYVADGRTVMIGASIGIALFPGDARDVATLMRGADAAMYQAKRHGGGYRLAISAS